MANSSSIADTVAIYKAVPETLLTHQYLTNPLSNLAKEQGSLFGKWAIRILLVPVEAVECITRACMGIFAIWGKCYITNERINAFLDKQFISHNKAVATTLAGGIVVALAVAVIAIAIPILLVLGVGYIFYEGVKSLLKPCSDWRSQDDLFSDNQDMPPPDFRGLGVFGSNGSPPAGAGTLPYAAHL